MKFIVSSTALSSHLQAISRVINSKNALPILDCFLFRLEDGTLSVTVSDGETTMDTTIEVNESDADGSFAVTAKTLLDALKELPEQPLTFQVNTDTFEILIQYTNGKYSLMATVQATSVAPPSHDTFFACLPSRPLGRSASHRGHRAGGGDRSTNVRAAS